MLELPSIGQYWKIFGVPVLSNSGLFTCLGLGEAGIVLKLTVMEHEYGPVLYNTCVQVSVT